MKLKRGISKNVMVRLLFFVALTGSAVVLDFYFEEHPGALEELSTEEENGETCDRGAIYLFSQVNSFSAKSPEQRSSGKKFPEQAHDRLIQRCHQLRNHLALKTEILVHSKPLFLSYHHLIFRNYYFTYPDDDVSFS